MQSKLCRSQNRSVMDTDTRVVVVVYVEEYKAIRVNHVM